MTPAEFDDRVQLLLDARRDPLADAECAAFLAEHPAHVGAFARLQRRLRAVPPSVPDRATRTRWRINWPAVAAAAAMAFAAWAWAAGPVAAAPQRGRVFDASLQPRHPRLQPHVAVTARHVLLTGPTAHVETFVVWSTP